MSFATATPLVDPRDGQELRQSGIPVYDGTTAELETVLEEGGFGIALCTAWQIAELYNATIRRVSPSTAVLVDAPSLQFVRSARRSRDRAVEADPLPPLGAEYGSETTGELNVYAAADAVLTASLADANLLNVLLAEEGLASWVPDAVDASASNVPFARRTGIAVPAVGDDPALADAADYVHTEIESRIDGELLARHPLTLVGEAPVPRGLLERARLTVLALRDEPESRRILIESLLAGTPVVTTSVGIRGLDLADGDGVLVADGASSLAAAVECLTENEALWRRLARAGRSRLKALHDPEAVRVRFLEALARAQEGDVKSRAPEGASRERFDLRLRRRRNRQLVPCIRQVVRASVPADAHILVVSDGADELLRLGRGTVAHFPRTGADSEVGARPSDSDEAIALLEQEISAGANYLVIPSTAAGWLDSYPAFADYLRDRFPFREEEACTVVTLRAPRGETARPATSAQPATAPVRLIAFYLPQFHPVPENDEWWGPGFTEWSNVARARPLFSGHDQPCVPGDLGFYDLRLAETREEQARLAAEAGIEAFCYYHYWFHGTRLLETPFAEVLASGRPDFPFCLCWANEPWSRRWDGTDDDVLQAQSYSPEDDLEHIRWLLPALTDPRALTVDGKPVFLVYDVRDLPDPARTVDLWRREARAAGLRGLHLIAVEKHHAAGWDFTHAGFDATVRFQPQFTTLLGLPSLKVDGPDSLRVWDYEEAWRALAKADPAGYRRYESVFTGWDNTPRREERGWVLHNATPESYGRWLTQVATEALSQPPQHRLVFVNAWNEWAEGAYLEPDRRHGRAYLDATRAALHRVSGQAQPEDHEPEADEAESIPASVHDEPIAVEEPEPYVDVPLGTEPQARAIAFYLPQFHPTPENDEWWGPGFTEWTNVVRAEPLFPGHYQPHLPSHLGFYDLRVPEVREAQAQLARDHGIEAFCYWHYWFSGTQLLYKPFEDTLRSGHPDFPFCLAWANESWSRRWLGESRDILIEQEYSAKDDVEHARWLLEAFADPRYLRVLGRPVFVVYRPRWHEDPRRLTETLRSECVGAGLPEPLLLGTTSWDGTDCRQLGFDGTIEFEPRFSVLGDPTGEDLNVHDYVDARARMRAVRDFPVYPTIVVAWDNTPRRGGMGTVLTNATPETFGLGFRELVESVQERPFADRLVFVNAWNEWAEGNHLEPDERYGLGYLEAVRRVIFAPAPQKPVHASHRGPANLSAQRSS